MLAASDSAPGGERLSTDFLPALSIVIPTRNRAAHLRECLLSLRDARHSERVEVMVMDQSDGEDSQAVAGEPLRPLQVRYVRMPRPGACPARNFGAALSRAPLIAFLDDDCCVTQDWIEKIDARFTADPGLQFVFGQLRAPPDADSAAGYYPEFLPTPDWQQSRTPRRIAMVAAGANMIARRDFLYRLGGFDELLGPAVPTVKSNDSSISYKVLRSRERWIASSEIEVIHKNGFRPYEQLGRLFVEYDHGLGVNWARFVRRGDMRALWYFLLEQLEMTSRVLGQLRRLRRPSQARNALAHLKGFWDGIRLTGSLGYVSGAELQRMAATGQLDPDEPMLRPAAMSSV
jgi:glycosyltransferase involved in cell wall biosynthesis